GRGDLRVVQGGDERDGRARGHGRAGGPVHRQAHDGRGDRGEGDPADALGGVVTAPDGGLAVGERGQDGRGDGDVRRALPGDGRQAGAVGVGVGVGERRVVDGGDGPGAVVPVGDNGAAAEAGVDPVHDHPLPGGEVVRQRGGDGDLVARLAGTREVD